MGEFVPYLRRNYTKSLSGIETCGMSVKNCLKPVLAAITLNPYQGLKQSVGKSKSPYP